MKVVVESLIQSGPSLFYTVFLYMFFLMLFAQVFLLFYNERFHHKCGHNAHYADFGQICNSDEEEPEMTCWGITHPYMCEDEIKYEHANTTCMAVQHSVSFPNFDNYAEALVS